MAILHDEAEAQVQPPLPCPADESTRDSVIYGDANWSYTNVNGTARAIGIDTIASYGNTGSGCSNEWNFASPSAPNADVVEHLGAAVEVPNMSPPARGTFWFTQYYEGKILIAHFSACANNPLPGAQPGSNVNSGCTTGSQSIGEFDPETRTYNRLDIKGADSRALTKGSVADIEVDRDRRRLYYIGEPNYIGYFERTPDGSSWDLNSGAHISMAHAKAYWNSCTIDNPGPGSGWPPFPSPPNPAPCFDGPTIAANQLTLLPTGDIAVTDWVGKRVLVFDGNLSRAPAAIQTPESHRWGCDFDNFAWVNCKATSYLQPLSIESSPVCAGFTSNGKKCRKARFVVNFDTLSPGDHHPIQEYIWDSGEGSESGGFYGMSSRPVVVKAQVLKTPNASNPSQDRYEWLDGVGFGETAASVRGINYDSDGNLWVGAFDARDPAGFSQYDPTEVQVFVPQLDSSAPGGQRFPWHQQSAPGPGDAQCNLWTPSVRGNYLVCLPESTAESKRRFLSSGRYVDSFVQAGADMYWGGWAGSFEGVIRTNPGMWPPRFEEIGGQPIPSQPGSVWRSDKRKGDPCRNASMLPSLPWPDAYQTMICQYQERLVKDKNDPNVSVKNREHIGAIRTPDTMQRDYFNTYGDLIDQQVHLVFDPDHSAVWTTVQSMWACGSKLGWKPNGAGPACPGESAQITTPQWLLRHNVYPRAPKVLNPTGSVTANAGEPVWVGASVYSTLPPSVVVEIRDSSGNVSQLLAADVKLIRPSRDSGPYKVKAKIDVPSDGSALGYRIIATNMTGSDVAPADQGGSPAYFDVVASTSSATEWHFAEGYVAPGWVEYLTVANSNSTAAEIDVIYRPDVAGLAPCVTHKSVASKGRTTLNARDELATASGTPACAAIGARTASGVGLGASVVSTNGVAVVAERPIYFNAEVNLGWISGRSGEMSVSGASNVMGATRASERWHFAEGYFRSTYGSTSDNWSVYLVLANPGLITATAEVTLLPESSSLPRLTTTATVGPGVRRTIAVTEELLKPTRQGVGAFFDPAKPPAIRPPAGETYADGTGFGIDVTATSPIVAERPVYFVTRQFGNPEIRGGDVAVGAVGPRTRWAFAEGAEGSGFNTYLTLANPGDSQATAVVTYLRAAGSPVAKSYPIAARSRRTITVGSELATLVGSSPVVDVAFDIRSDSPLVAERPSYYRSGVGIDAPTPVDGGHVAFGTTAARTEWNFAEGYRPPSGCPFASSAPAPRGAVEYLTLANPGPGVATVVVDFLPDSASAQVVTEEYEVAAGRRITVAPHAYLGKGGGQAAWCGRGFGMRVRSVQKQGSSAAQPIIAERPMYWNQAIGGVYVNAGHVVLPIHNLGIQGDPATGVNFPLADVSSRYSEIDMSGLSEPRAPIGIVRLTEDLTATAGQIVTIEARTEGGPETVTLHVSPVPRDETASAPPDVEVAMTRVDTDIFRAEIQANQTAMIQAVARTGTSVAVSAPSAITVAAGAITGRVTSEGSDNYHREPVAGVTINILGNEVQVGSVETNADGYYYALVPGPGDYRLAFLPNNAPGVQPGYADRYSTHVNSWQDWSPITVGESGIAYDETLALAGRISGTVFGELPPGSPTALTDVSVSFFDSTDSKVKGRSAFTDESGKYEIWLKPGSYFGLVNSATGDKPLGWNGYSPIWSRGQLFDNANGGQMATIDLPSPESAVVYDEVLPKVYPVSGRVVPIGGPGLGAGGAVGSYKAIAPNGQFWAVELPADGNYTYPLPNGNWKLVYVIPGYELSYYHNTSALEEAETITVSGSPVVLQDQEIRPPP